MLDNGDGTDAYLLEVEGLAKQFKGLRAVDGYRLQLRPGEILGIIGPNGAGKSTVFNLLTGHIRPTGRHPAIPRPGHHAPAPGADRRAGHRADIPEHPPVLHHERAGQRRLRPPAARAGAIC